MQPFKTVFIPPAAALETPRLRIRVDSEETYAERFRTATDTELMAWCGFANPGDLALQRAKIAGGLSNYRTSVVFFHLTERASERVIGSLAFHNWYPMHRRAELGYALTDAAKMNQGFMKEALPEVLRFGFSAIDLNRVEAFTSPDNTASRRLLERAAFCLEGELREHYDHKGITYNSVVYGLLRSEWSGAAGRG